MPSSDSTSRNYAAIFTAFSVFTNILPADVTKSPCEFPPDIRGRWVRSRDMRSIIFSDIRVIGLAVRYQHQVMNKFKCHTVYGDYLILYDTHDAERKTILNYYMCWQLIRVSPHAYILYELTNKWNQPHYQENRTGYVQDAYSPVNVTNVCAAKPSDIMFTTLYRYNAPLNDISSMCPESLLATFSYNACKTAELDFCSDRKTVIANYKMCPSPFLNSVSGSVKCMGFVKRGKELYLNLYSEGYVFCTEVPELRGLDGSIMLTVYMVDCSYVSVKTNASVKTNVSVKTNASVSTNVGYNEYTTYLLVEKTSCPPIVKPLQLKDISNIVMLIIGGCMGTALLLNFACYCKYRRRRDSETPEELSQSSSQETPKNSPKKEGSTVSDVTIKSTKSQTQQAKTPKTVKSPKGATTLFTKYKDSNADSSAYSVTL